MEVQKFQPFLQNLQPLLKVRFNLRRRYEESLCCQAGEKTDIPIAAGPDFERRKLAKSPSFSPHSFVF